MHIHLPKPLHGWREFVGEVGIIVIGVLIALGAEQTIEATHWEHKANDTIDAIKHELADDYGQAVEAASVAPCVDRQLVMLEEAVGKPGFRSAATYSDSAFNRFVVRMPSRPWATSVWTAATSEGTVTHLPIELRKGLQAAYQQIGILELNARQADVISWRLRALALPTTADQRARAIEDIEELRGHIGYLALLANQVMGHADAIGMRPPTNLAYHSMRRSGTAKFCRAHGIALGRPEPEPPS